MRIVIALTACLLSALFQAGFSTAAHAQQSGIDEMLQDDAAMVMESTANLAQSKAILLGKAPEQWSDVEIQTYLADAMWVLYWGINYYSDEEDHLPWYYPTLAGTKYVPQWPGNPFNNWEPMLVLGPQDGFSAGDLVIQVCPLEFYSFIADPRPLSYELGVYGPTVEYAANGNAAPDELNTWAIVPTGALYMVGTYAESCGISQQKVNQ